MTSQDPAAAPSETLTFGLLVDMTDYHVHAVYDAADPYPLAVCGVHLVPGIWLPGLILRCRRCFAALPDPHLVELRPASTVRRRVLAADPDHEASPFLAVSRRYLAWRYDRRLRRALPPEWRCGRPR